MKILYDGQIYRLQAAGGINRYFASLISRLPETDEPTVLGVGAQPVNFPAHPRLRLNRLLPGLPGRFVPAYLRHARPPLPTWDVAHPTYYELTSGCHYGDYRRIPVVVTAHDFIHALHPELMVDGEAVFAQQKEAFEAATAIICVSHNTRADLLHFLPHLEAKTTVIHHGIELTSGTDPLPAPEGPYFLYVGSRSSYKNFEPLLAAFARACTVCVDLRLCVAGGNLNEHERGLAFDLGVRDRLLVESHPSDSRLATLYRHSLALLYPSRYEGFGIPPLEAMAYGTVAVTANTSSLPEIVGDAGIQLDPMRPDDWTDTIVNLARNPEARAPYLEKGPRRAATFTWEEAVRKTRAVYQAVIDAR